MIGREFPYHLSLNLADADNTGHCPGTACGGLYANVFYQAMRFAGLKAAYLGSKTGILAIGVFLGHILHKLCHGAWGSLVSACIYGLNPILITQV